MRVVVFIIVLFMVLAGVCSAVIQGPRVPWDDDNGENDLFAAILRSPYRKAVMQKIAGSGLMCRDLGRHCYDSAGVCMLCGEERGN